MTEDDLTLALQKIELELLIHPLAIGGAGAMLNTQNNGLVTDLYERLVEDIAAGKSDTDSALWARLGGNAQEYLRELALLLIGAVSEVGFEMKNEVYLNHHSWPQIQASSQKCLVALAWSQ